MNKGLGPIIVIAIIALPLWVWYGWRIEPGNGEIAILIKKTGRNLPPEAILAPGPEYKGIQEDVLPEGRYFRNPWTWEWRFATAVDIPAGKFGVLVRKFGKDLPEGEILAKDGTKGILPDVLGTGKHRVNPFAYEVKLYDDITIKPGHVGVVTELTGDDILVPGGAADAETGSGFLVKSGAKGVSPKILKEGTHRLNPFVSRRGVTSHNHQCRIFLRQQVMHALPGVFVNHFKRARSVGRTCVVAQVDIVVHRQRMTHLFQDGQAAVTAVKNTYFCHNRIVFGHKGTAFSRHMQALFAFFPFFICIFQKKAVILHTETIFSA